MRNDPYDANGDQRFQSALVAKTIGDFVEGCAEYRPLRLLKSGGGGAGKSGVIRALTDLVRQLLGSPAAAKVYAPTGVAAFLAGGSTGRSPPKHPKGRAAFGQIEPLMGDAMRKVQGNLSRRALLVGNERRAIYSWVAGVQCLPSPHIAQGPVCRVLGR